MEQFSPPPPEHEPTERTPLLKRFLQDFYLGFKFSQGDKSVQDHLYSALGRFYHANLMPPDIWDKESVLTEAQARAVKMRPPHKSGSAAVLAEAEFENRWEDFDKAVRHPNTVHDERVAFHKLLEGQIKRDIKYQGTGRLLVKDGGDRHESQVREYILNRLPTGSEGYDAIFGTIHEHFRAVSAETELPKLVRMWETNHPGEKFYPPEFADMQPTEQAA